MRNFSRIGICTAVLILGLFIVGGTAVAQEPYPTVDPSQQQAQPQQPAQPVDPQIDQSKVDEATKTQTERTDTMQTETEGSELPRTASNILLAAIGGFLSLGGGLVLRSNRRRN